jgi:hypothetical protein
MFKKHNKPKWHSFGNLKVATWYINDIPYAEISDGNSVTGGWMYEAS